MTGTKVMMIGSTESRAQSLAARTTDFRCRFQEYRRPAWSHNLVLELAYQTSGIVDGIGDLLVWPYE